jgi:hypothetical protein
MHKAGRLGLNSRHIHRWTMAERKTISIWYRKMPTAELAKKFGVTKEALRRMAVICGLTRYTLRRYSTWDREFLLKHYATMPNREIARRLQRTRGAIEAYAKKLGLNGTKKKPEKNTNQ